MLEFASESDPAAIRQAVQRRSPRRWRFPGLPGPQPGGRQRGWLPAPVLIAVAAAGTGGWAVASGRLLPSAAGAIRVETTPPGVSVRVDGVARGVTPLSLTLAAGEHTLRLERDGAARDLPIVVRDGTDVVHHLEWTASPPIAPPTVARPGSLRVVTEPAGASIEVDGIDRGRSPILLPDVPAGDHQVVVRGSGAVHRRAVHVDDGVLTSLVLSITAPAAISGTMQVFAGIPLQIYEQGDLIGTSEARTLMLPTGRHELDFVNDALGFRTRQTIEIAAGRTTDITIPLDTVPLNINAIPWAEVWIDGARIGETPMAAVMTTIGPHQVQFRHPELGTKTARVQLSLKEPARLSVDMRTP